MEEQLLCHGNKVKLFHKSSPTHKVCPFVSEQDLRLHKEKEEEGSLLEFRLVAFLGFHHLARPAGAQGGFQQLLPGAPALCLASGKPPSLSR